MAEHDEKQYHNERIVRISSSSANDGQAITLEGKLNLLYRQRLKE
jgi:hypothetical protein